jgi:electron transport complex protein RnfD
MTQDPSEAKPEEAPEGPAMEVTGKPVVSPSPHLAAPDSVPRIMWTVVATLAPALFVGIYFFHLRALWVVLVCTAAAVLTEWAGRRFVFGKRDLTIGDGSAVVTGVLLAFCLPASVPLWQAAVGSVVAVFIGKLVFGGLGNNLFNPALVGRAVLLAAWPTTMSGAAFLDKVTSAGRELLRLPEGVARLPHFVDAVTAATPLAAVKEGKFPAEVCPSWYDLNNLFIGRCGGCLGETSALAVLIGGIWLLYRRIISWHIPVVYIGTVFLIAGAVKAPAAFEQQSLSPILYMLQWSLFHILGGGLFLGAFFMATDMVTSPMTGAGKCIFAAGAGILVVLIRLLGGYPEGVCYSILLMNMVVPLIDRYVGPRKFGAGRGA